MQKGKTLVEIKRYESGVITEVADTVVTEEPLQICINGNPRCVAMYLPGEETELALGYCFTEGIIDSMDDVLHIGKDKNKEGNHIDITINEKRLLQEKHPITRDTLPSQTVCGIRRKETAAEIRRNPYCREDSCRIFSSQIDSMMRETENRQIIFGETGGTHATAVFGKNCELLSFAEDVGRHNALDKTLGKLISDGKIEEVTIIISTSRLSYKMVQKAGRSNAQVLVGMSIATSLAIDLARSINLTLIGFARNGRGNIYTGLQRIIEP